LIDFKTAQKSKSQFVKWIAEFSAAEEFWAKKAARKIQIIIFSCF
jgi:hypothetical protein